MSLASWVEGAGEDHPFGLHNLAYGSASPRFPPGTWPTRNRATGSGRRLVVRIGDEALDLGAAARRLLPELSEVLDQPTLNGLLGEGPATWRRVRSALTEWLGDKRQRAVVEPLLAPLGSLLLHLPVEVADYVDFYASEHHARNLGRFFRPGDDPLPLAWKHLPVAYHGRAGTVVLSGTPVRRPSGLRRLASGEIQAGPSLRLDVEVEVGFVLGNPTRLGEPVTLGAAGEHLFGVCLVNDWSARDIQRFEYVPLGPFLGKSFATSLSPWVVPMAALEQARISPPARDVPLASYLDDTTGALAPGGLELQLSLRVNGTELSRPPYSAMYWTSAQMVAHLTANGASIRAGDLLASGTVSGAAPDQLGSLIELTANGTRPVRLDDGSTRSFLEDGDIVAIAGRAPATALWPETALGEVVGEVLPGA